MTKQYISPASVHRAPTYSHAVKVGNTIYVSGQVASDVDGNVVSGFEAQAEKAFENLRSVLEAAGASLEDVVKLNTYLTDMANRPLLGTVRARYFRSEPLPASTLVQVVALARPEFLIEIEAVAVVD